MVKATLDPSVLEEGTYDKHRVLTGFMSESHLGTLAQPTIAQLESDFTAALRTQHKFAQEVARALPPEDLTTDMVQPLPSEMARYGEVIRQTDPFQEVYSNRDVRFGMVDAGRLCAFQPNIRTVYDTPPPDEELSDILMYCLPEEFEERIEAQVSQNGKHTDLTLTSISPNVSVEGMSLEGRNAVVTFGPKKNWVQVARYENRYYLKNGYHRTFSLLEKGINRVPAIVYDAESWEDTGGQKSGFFGYDYLSGLQRPPLMKDFFSEAAMEIPLRETRKVIRISVDEFSVPV